jgi:HEPN domain-containing protein
MKDPEQARSLLRVARRDYRALCGMEDPAVFSNEVFGFHVQQAVEKALKAWLCCLGGALSENS